MVYNKQHSRYRFYDIFFIIDVIFCIFLVQYRNVNDTQVNKIKI